MSDRGLTLALGVLIGLMLAGVVAALAGVLAP